MPFQTSRNCLSMNGPRTNAERIKLLRKIFSNPGKITSFFRIERILNARRKSYFSYCLQYFFLNYCNPLTESNHQKFIGRFLIMAFHTFLPMMRIKLNQITKWIFFSYIALRICSYWLNHKNMQSVQLFTWIHIKIV